MSTDCENAPSRMSDPTADLQLRQSSSSNRRVVVGLYGVPGAGKTFLLTQLMHKLGKKDFVFYEGSEMIANIVPGGLNAFQAMQEEQQAHWRESAIDQIGKYSHDSGQTAIVTGHFMFWPEDQEAGKPVYTQKDLEVFTHILYLDVRSEIIVRRRGDETDRIRPPTSATHLRKWQQEEKTQLRSLCRSKSILFSLIHSHPQLPEKVSTLVRNFRYHTDEYNLSRAEARLDEIVVAARPHLETILVMDADKTLAPEDAGTLFWEKLSKSPLVKDGARTLQELFSSALGYSYTAFRQAMLMYEETLDDQGFDTICKEVASAVTMHPAFVSLLRLVAEQKYVGAIVVTSGLRRVWEKVLEREGLSETVKVIGGGRLEDGFIVSASVKGSLVKRLKEVHRMYVWAFGDSQLDLEMLSEAHDAIVVVGEEQFRSRSMDQALMKAINHEGLKAKQTVLPRNASQRLDVDKLPLIDLTNAAFVKDLFRYSVNTLGGLQLHCPTDSAAAKLLATPMRDAAVAGPDLKNAHRRAGHYLALEFVADVIGLEESPIRHVLGRPTTGSQLFHERQTTIVALMRGGEPMASGVNDAFPQAMFVHARNADDLKPHHLQGQVTVILVDSVVNTGKTIIEFVQHVYKLHATIRIVVVAGVVQAQCLTNHVFDDCTRGPHPKLHLIALRLSETKFTGSGTTDTGNRLFNTTHLP